MRKFIKTRPNRPERNPPIIDFQDEIIQMYVVPEGTKKGVEIKGSLSSSWMNSLIPRLLWPLWQNGSLCKTIGMKMKRLVEKGDK